MKNIITRIMMLVMLASIFACSNELESTGGYTGDQARAKVNFTGLNGFAVTRAVDQTAVANVTVYLFEGTESTSPLKYTLPVTLGSKSEAGLPGTFEVPEAGAYHIEAIANAEALTGIETYGDFLARTTSTAFEGNLVMQGATAGDVAFKAAQETDMTMELVRLAATFAVNADAVPELNVSSFTLKDAVQTSYYVQHAQGESFSIPAGAATAENTVPYAYENPENTTKVAISGTLNGAAYTTEVAVPQVRRNHLYTVKLVDNSGSIEAELTVTDWSTISANLDIAAGNALKMTAATDTNSEPEATVVYPETDEQKSTATVNVPTEDATTYYIWVGSANIEAALTNTVLPEGWTLTAPADTRTNYLWQKGYWPLTIPVNTSTESKSLTVTATNKLDEDATVSITFVQEGKGAEVVDHSKNPLLKWAEADLVYDRLANKNSIATSYQTQGYLYQWGRHYGFKNYMDALEGVEVWKGVGRQKCYGYATYKQYYKTGTGMSSSGYDNQSGYNYDDNSPFAVDEMPIFFMNPLGTDYWLGSGGGSTWEERAEACGFTTSICPDGWRIPTQADFLEIIPSEALQGSEGLASVINNRAELKKIDGVCIYAIRWSAETVSSKTYLRIDALVVPDNFGEEALQSIDWTNENVVTRYFGANGYINAYYHPNTVSDGSTFPVARPMPGVETHTDLLWQSGNYWTILWNYIRDYSVNNEGYYWMSDKKGAFIFQDNTRIKPAKDADGNQPFASRLSVVGVLSINPQNCCAIRCVRDSE